MRWLRILLCGQGLRSPTPWSGAPKFFAVCDPQRGERAWVCGWVHVGKDSSFALRGMVFACLFPNLIPSARCRRASGLCLTGSVRWCADTFFVTRSALSLRGVVLVFIAVVTPSAPCRCACGVQSLVGCWRTHCCATSSAHGPDCADFVVSSQLQLSAKVVDIPVMVQKQHPCCAPVIRQRQVPAGLRDSWKFLRFVHRQRSALMMEWSELGDAAEMQHFSASVHLGVGARGWRGRRGCSADIAATSRPHHNHHILVLMLSLVGSDSRTGLGILRLMPLLTWEGVISRRKSWVFGGPCLMLGSPDIPPCFSFIGTWLLLLAKIMMGEVGRPLINWDQASRKKQRRIGVRVNVDLAVLLGPPGFLNGTRVQVQGGCTSGAVVAACPCSVCLPCKFSAFLSSLHWPAGTEDMGNFGFSYLEILILFEQWAGHRLLSEHVTRPHVRAHRPISVSSVPVSKGIEIRQGCRFIISLIRALGKFLVELAGFLPCQVGSHMSRLRHLGWEQ